MRHFFTAFALVMVSIPMLAHAQERFPKWYAGVQGSMSFVDDTDVDVTGVGNTGNLDFDTGYGVSLALGYMPSGTGTFVDSMRFDLEYYYRNSSLDSFNGLPISDDLSSKSAMANAYYDVNTGTRWMPYVGAGVGMSEVSLDVSSSGVDDNDIVFAWNVMAGLGYAPESIPNTVWSIGYRYFSTSDPEFHSSGTNTGVKIDYDVHNVEAGVRMMF